MRAIAAASLVACAVAASAAAAAPRRALTVAPASVHRGGAVAVHGVAGGCPLGDRVTIMSRAFPRVHAFAGVPAVFARVLAGDRFHTSARVPARTAPGRYVVTARCGGGNLGVAAHLLVLP